MVLVFTGDKVNANLNSGELILNAAQQDTTAGRIISDELLAEVKQLNQRISSSPLVRVMSDDDIFDVVSQGVRDQRVLGEVI